MAIIDILLPKMGESVAEATITKLVVGWGWCGSRRTDCGDRHRQSGF